VTDRRLIEDYLPVVPVSAAARQERYVSDGHISSLHLWWARRPIGAARAAVFAALLPAGATVEASKLDTFFERLCIWRGPSSVIAEARQQILQATGGKQPEVLDMFAGGGAIPLEAARLGCKATALELNPVAHLIELCTLDYPQRFGVSLAEDVRRWGGWLVQRAKTEVGDLYPELETDGNVQPTLDGTSESAHRTPIAYFWTRTVPCPNPAEQLHAVPLVRQTWLVKKKNRCVALRMIPDRATMTVSYEVVEAPSEAALEFDPAGFSHRGSTTCPLCGASVALDYARDQIRGGRWDVELMAVAVLPPSGRGKEYVAGHEARRLIPDDAVIKLRLQQLAEDGVRAPDEEITDISGHTNVYRYGLTTWERLFTRRQLVMLLTLCRLVRHAHSEMLATGLEPERARAVAAYLGLLVDRVADRSSTLGHWQSSTEVAKNTFARQALPMTWDFPETNPFGGSGGDLSAHLAGIAKVIAECATAGEPARVVRGSATELPFEDAEFDAVITDPPYYDNIPYADLADFFYVWLKRSVGHLYPEHFAAPLSPKRNEAIAASYRHNGDKHAAKAAYEWMMERAFTEARRVLKPEGILVCVYAHQTTEGWSTLIEAVRRAGFVVVEAWPLDTEMATRGVAQGTASLASSIFLVGRPRSDERTGDWAHEVRPELQEIVRTRVGELAEFGITGTDLVIAAIGAGMRAYTRYGRVEKPNGEELSPADYLEEVEREVAEAALERIFRTDRSGLGRVDQETQFYVMGRFEFGEALAPWDELNTLARGTGVELAPLTRGPRALVAFGEKRDRARLRDYRDRGGEPTLGLHGTRATIDHLHRILWLLESRPTSLTDYLAQARPDPERLRLVAHALARPGLDTAGLHTRETAACDQLLAVWHRVLDENIFTGERA
jgi:putative DNA methylase